MFDQPHDGMYFEVMQRLVNSEGKDEKQYVAMLQLYSDKTLVTFKGKSAHPIRGTLLNIGYASRINNIQ